MTDPITAEWTRTDADRKAVEAGCYFDLQAAERVRAFLARFTRHSKGEFKGKSFELLPWQWREVIAPFFGWMRPDGTRRYRRFSVWVSKKNGKSTLCAALILYALLGDGEGGPEVYSAAADKNQASIIYREAASMVRQSSALAKHLDPIDTTKRIVRKDRSGFYEVLSKETKKTGHGINASAVILDEVHVVDRETYETLRYAGAARRQPIFGEISTAGNNRDSLGYERYTYAKRVRDGDIEDPELLAVIYEASGNDAWESPEEWQRANPSLGVTITHDSFKADFNEAKNGTAATQASFKQLRLNLWQDSVSPWFPVEEWMACEAPIAESELIGLPCWGGLDLSESMDLTACVWCFRLPDDKGYYFLPRFWCPEDADTRRQQANKALLRPWVQAKEIRIASGMYSRVINYDVVEADVLEDVDKFRPLQIAFDPWNATSVVGHLKSSGRFGDDGLVKYPQQTQHYNGPMKEFERLIRARQVKHGGSPVMRFCVKNVMIYQDTNNNIRPHKGKSADRIDGATAAVMSLGLAMLSDAKSNWYDPKMMFS